MLHLTDSNIFFQVHKLPITKESGSERSSISLNEKLATVLLDSHSGDDPLAKHDQKSQQEIRGILLSHFPPPLWCFFSDFFLSVFCL